MYGNVIYCKKFSKAMTPTARQCDFRWLAWNASSTAFSTFSTHSARHV